MGLKKKNHLIIFSLLIFLLSACGELSSIGSEGILENPKCKIENKLFQIQTNSIQALQAQNATDISIEKIDIHPDTIESFKRAYLQGQNVEFLLPLNSDLEVNAITTKIKMRGKSLIVKGTILEDPSSEFHFSIRDNVLVANIYFMFNEYKIRTNQNEDHMISQSSAESQIHTCDNDEMPDQNNSHDNNIDITNIAPAEVDIVIGYTTAAKDQNGSESSILALVDLLIEYMNEDLATSGIPHTVRLVGSTEVSEASTGTTGDDLNALMRNSRWKPLNELASEVGADQVALLVEGPGSGTVGTANYPNRQGYFSVSRMAASSRITFSHELGHNYNATHNDSHTGSSGFKTIMNASSSRSSVRVFANPDVDYNGEPSGTSSKNAAGKINTQMPKVADFREAKVPSTPAPTPNPSPNPNPTPSPNPSPNPSPSPTPQPPDSEDPGFDPVTPPRC